MKAKVNLYKLEVNNILMNCPQEYIEYKILCQNKKENFEPVFNYLIELLDSLEKHTNKYINKLLNGIISYIECYNEKKCEISEEIKGKIKKIENNYLEIVKNNNKEPDKNIIKTIEELLKVIEKNNFKIENNQPIIDDDNNIHYTDLHNKKIETLQKRIEELKIKEEKNDKKKKTLYEEIRSLKQEINELSQDKINLEQIITNNEQQLTNDKNKNQELENEINRLQNLNEKLHSYLISAEKKVKQKEEEIKSINDNIKLQEEKEIENKKIDNEIIELCLKDRCTLSKLEAVLNNKGIKCTANDILESINRLRATINLNNAKTKTFPQTYQIHKPNFDTNCDFKINNFDETLNLIITADWHLSQDNSIDKIINKVEKLYNYCAANNIELIINLGDLLDINENNRKDKFFSTMELLDEIIEKLPKDKQIRNAILGGNHDKRMFEVGVEPLQYLENNREDYINLGYDEAKIVFSRNTKNQIIGLHHPDSYKLNVNDILGLQSYLINYLNNFNENNKLQNNEVYMNLLGHFHISRIDLTNNYCLVPPFIKTNAYNYSGVWHLKLYFDSLGNIDYITIKSLITDKQLLPVNEIVYQKTK